MAARNELAFFAYLVAKPRQRLMLKKAFSTKYLNLRPLHEQFKQAHKMQKVKFLFKL